MLVEVERGPTRDGLIVGFTPIDPAYPDPSRTSITHHVSGRDEVSGDPGLRRHANEEARTNRGDPPFSLSTDEIDALLLRNARWHPNRVAVRRGCCKPES